VRKSLHRRENLVLIELLRDMRVRLDLRQVELAERLHVNQNFVSNVEQGIRRLDVVELRDYAEALQSTFAELTATWERLLVEGAGKGRKRSRGSQTVAPSRTSSKKSGAN
jgi:transcriptional regulator with XRE-family HTH domain